MKDTFPFLERSGLDVVDVSRGSCRLKMPIEGNGNHVGIMYAGALFTLAEVPGGVVFGSIADAKRFYPIVGELNIRFTNPVTTDAFVTATLSDEEIDRIVNDLETTGKTKYILELEVTDDADKVVATTSGTYLGRSF